MKNFLIAGCLFAALTVLAGLAFAQVAPLRFEVATIKLSKDATSTGGSCHGVDSQYGNTASPPPLGRCRFLNYSLADLIRQAYGIRQPSQIEGPGWASPSSIYGAERYMIEAKADNPESATRDQLLRMLQTMLSERFNLTFHRESKEVSGLQLVVSRGGPKFAPHAQDHLTGIQFRPEDGELVGGTSMGQLARFLSGPAGLSQTVTDKTGLIGDYDFVVHWAPTTDVYQSASILTAVQEQLGLRVESTRVATDTVVIDHVDKPTPN